MCHSVATIFSLHIAFCVHNRFFEHAFLIFFVSYGDSVYILTQIQRAGAAYELLQFVYFIFKCLQMYDIALNDSVELCITNTLDGTKLCDGQEVEQEK